MTTREKIQQLIRAVQETPPDEYAPESRDLIEFVQIARGLGIDPLASLLPTSDAETDLLIDKLIALLLEVRGDELPPFDLDRYGEALAD